MTRSHDQCSMPMVRSAVALRCQCDDRRGRSRQLRSGGRRARPHAVRRQPGRRAAGDADRHQAIRSQPTRRRPHRGGPAFPCPGGTAADRDRRGGRRSRRCACHGSGPSQAQSRSVVRPRPSGTAPARADTQSPERRRKSRGAAVPRPAIRAALQLGVSSPGKRRRDPGRGARRDGRSLGGFGSLRSRAGFISELRAWPGPMAREREARAGPARMV